MSPVRHHSGTRAASAILRAARALLLTAATFAMCNLVVACGRGIGDACETSLRCSASATRLCDLTQPGGYCTLSGCQPGGCPGESVCVTFWQKTLETDIDRNRLSTNYCMKKCDERSDCRDDEGYDCLSGADFGYKNEATVEGAPGQRFCAVRLPSMSTMSTMSPAPAADAGVSQ